MDIEDEERDSPAIRTLGPLFKLTEVFLWNDGFKEIRRGSSLPEQIIFKYDDDNDVNEDDCGDRTNSNVDVPERADGEAPADDVGVLLEEYMNLAQQMSALGLPLLFQTSKDKKNGTRRKQKDTGIMSLREKIEDEALQSAKLSEKENTLDEGFKNAEIINFDDMALEEHVCDELSSPEVPSDDGISVEDFCITVEQPQSSVVAESSYEDVSCYCTGSFGDWTAIWDSYYMRNYFYNIKTNESTWYPPPGMEHLTLSNISNESNADIVTADPDLPTSRNERALSCKSLEGKFGTEGKLIDQPEDAAEMLSSGVRASDACSFTLNANGSQVFDGDCFDLSQPCSSLDIDDQSLDLDDNIKQMPSSGTFDNEIPCPTYVDSAITEASSDQFLITQVDEEGMEIITSEIYNEDIPPATTKKKKKARKSRSRKKSLSSDQERLFQSTVDAYCSGIGKYWCQRYLLFSKFDQGIKMDEEGWFSVTPESIARHQASRCGSGVLIDCFTGVGGNAIQFAKTGRHVIAIDIDPRKIEYAKHNAAIYGVEGQIDFVIGDSFSLASNLEADTVFMSPPWGGPEYSKLHSYDMAMLKPHNWQFLFNTFKETASMIVMFLPRNVDLNQLAEICLSAGPLWSVEVEKNFLNDKLKAVTAYFCKAASI